MKSYQQIKRSLASAERAVDSWHYKLDEALQNYAVFRQGNNLVPLAEAYRDAFYYESDAAPLQISNVANALAQSGDAVFGWDYDNDDWQHRKNVTRRAIAHIARLEKKLNDWNAVRFWLENVLDDMSEDETVTCSAGFEECVRELAALGHDIR